MDLESLKRDLIAVSKVVSFKKFSMLGGEPLLHPQIDQFLIEVQQLNLFPVVSIVTNGQLLYKMTSTFWQNVRKLEVDIYPGKMDIIDIRYIELMAKKHNVELLLVPYQRFYKSCSKNWPIADVIQQRYLRCPTVKECYAVENGYLYRCPQSAIIPGLFLGLDNRVDGLPLDGLTVDKLSEFIKRPTHLISCSRCSVADEYIPWHEASRDKWLDESSI
jgi:hypothetical protein